jgi:NAD(P)-dependent dehydrogenase (short-subunit alcohol dehydrogenase family)
MALADRGWAVGFTFHEDEQGARDAAAELESRGGRAAFRQLDLEDPKAGPPVVDELAGELGPGRPSAGGRHPPRRNGQSRRA